MKKKIKQHLLLEQLEDRIFLSASPLAVAAGAEHHDGAEPVANDLHHNDPLALATESQIQHTGVPDSGHVKPVEQEQHKAAETTNSQDGAATEQADQGNPDAAATDNSHDNQSGTRAANDNGQQTGQDATLTDSEATGADTAAATNNVDPSASGEDSSGHAGDAGAADQTLNGQSADHEIASSTGEDTAPGDAADATAAHAGADDADSTHTADVTEAGDQTNETAMADGADAVATDDQAIDPMIGEDFEFTVSFDNTTGSDVFGPYIDLLLDGGQDGADAASDDGISFVGATYLGADMESFVHTIDATDVANGIEHPWATDNTGVPLIIHDIDGQAFQVGDQFVSLRMPFGSFTSDQPAAEVHVTAHMGENADVDVDLGVHTTTGAMYGTDALDNPTSDNPIRDIQTHSTAYKPEVITYHKDIIVSTVDADCQEQHDPTYDDTRQWADDSGQTFEQNHQEIPTGPNYPATYVATIDVADGQTVTNLSLTEHLADNIHYLGDNTITVNGSTSGFTVTHQGSDLIITLDHAVTGSADHDDVVIKYNFYVPDQTDTGTDIIDHTTGDDGHIINNGEVGYSWHPNDTNDPDVNATINPEVNANGHFSSNADVDDISHAQSIAIQKGHSLDNDTGQTGYTPGDRVQFTLDFEISDYFGFGNIVIDDLLADGMDLLTASDGFAPTITISEYGTDIVSSHELAIGSELVTGTNGTDDETLHFDISQVIGGDGILDGGYTDGHTDGVTRGTITYWAEIQQTYESAEGGGEENVDQGDVLSEGVTIQGDIYDYATDTLTSNSEADESCDSIEIITGSVEKDIYAVTNSGGTTFNPGNNPHLSPGDRVTYRIHYTMPLSSTEHFMLTDYLPLPVFDASDYSWSNTADATTYDGTNTPDAGHWGYTTNDTYHDLDVPDTVSAGTGNTLVFDYGEYHDGGDTDAVIEIVFTVTISDEPFADGMLLTNQVRATEESTLLAESDTDAIVQIVLDQPELHITKGVVATDSADGQFSDTVGPVNFSAPGSGGFRGDADITESGLAATPVDANLSGIDAGDMVTFAIIAENVGHSGAFDIKITDDMPAGFDIGGSGLNLSVTDGHGNDLDFTDASGDHVGDAGFDFFSGIILTDDADGALNANDDNLDQTDNIVVITYDLMAQSSVSPEQAITNTAQVADLAGTDGGPDHFPTDSDGPKDTAIVTVDSPEIDKHYLTSFDLDGDGTADSFTSQGHTSDANMQVAIGELITYETVITVPEGTTLNALISDNLRTGHTDSEFVQALVSIDSITASADLTFENGTAQDIADNVHTWNNSNGNGFTLDFGDITNSNSDNDTPETIIITYTAVVLDTTDTDRGDNIGNYTQFKWDANSDQHSIGNGVTSLTIVEPTLEVVKTVDNPHPDAGDTVTFTIVIDHAAASDSNAFDATLADTLPAGYNNIQITSQSGTGSLNGVTDAVTLSGNTLNGAWTEFDLGDTYTITLTADLADTTQAGSNLSNTAIVDWTSLPGDHTDLSPYADTGDTERSGTQDTSDPDDYVSASTAEVTVIGTIDKQDPSPINYTIGDQVTYDIVVTLPEGHTENLVVTDALPIGLQYVTHSIDTANFGGTLGTLSVNTPLADGDDIVFTFADTTTVDADGDTTNNSFTIQVTALVTTTASNVQEQDLTNEASMQFDDPAGGDPIVTEDPTDPTIHVVEPQITTVKDVADSADAGTDASPGETLTYTARFTNTGHSTAYEVTADDILPAGVTYNTASATISDSSGLLSAADVTSSVSGNTVSFSSSDGGWDIAVGGYVEIQYTVTVMAAGFQGGNHVNTIDADWSSQNGTDPYERTYDDSGTSPVDGDQDADNAAFTVVATASLGDTVFFDAAGDGGPFDAASGDVGISGVDVTISADVDGDGTPEFTQTVRTDADGRYEFTNLAAFDNYVISVDPATSGGVNPTDLTAAGFHQTYDLDEGTVALDNTATSISLTSGQHRTDIDFGYTGQNSVGDTVWFDVDGDGVQDDGTTGTPAEDGIGGLTVTLTADIDGDGVDEYTATTTTDEHGHYSFDHLPAGDYDITVTPPAGSTPTYDQDGGTGSPDNTTPFTLGADQDRDDIDFGIQGTGSIGDYVWYDADADSNQNDGIHAGLAGVTVTLSGDIDGDGTTDYTATTTTADDGSYSFDHLLGGTYTITVDDTTLPGGSSNWHQTYDEDGTGSANTVDHVLAAGSNDDTVDFGYTGTGSLGDTVWYDVNNNGVQEGTELGLAGVTVTISADVDGDGVDEYTDTAVTDAGGNYHFDHLPAADYTISVATGTLPAGATPTYDLDSATSSPDSTTLYTLGVGENTDRVDFGYTGSGAIGDTVWNDSNGDGILDPDENGFAGVTVTLTGDLDHDGQADDTITTTTDENGHYSFENLFLGDYTVAVDPATLPAGNSQTHDLDDPHTTTPNTPNSASVTLDAANPVNNDVDFGYNSKGTIGDTIWYDADNDGILDPGELGLAGVTVTLTGDVDGDGNPDTVVATTDSDGHYLFDQLQAGDYTITVSNLPAGMSQTADPDGVNDNTTTLTLAGGETNLDQDFGYTGTGSIGDTIWSDADGDGTQNNGETGLAGVTVTLTADLNNDGVVDTVTTTTDANGNYHFDNLPADNYTITVDPSTLPPGMQPTADPDGTNDNSATVTLAAGETNNDQDFGYQQTGTIGDTIWYDADGDGIQDPDELGLNGVTVTLTDANGNTVATTTTGSDGKYLFDNLNGGDYTITLTGLPAGMTQTADPDGGNDNASQVTIGGTSPLVNLDQDFGYTGTGSIGDTIWNDADGNGTQDNGESGLAGVTVTLTGDFNGDGIPDIVTTTTDSNGQYHFGHLPEGQYTITVDPNTLPPGMQPTADPDGGNDNTANVTLAAGEANNDQDFGYQQSGTIGDTIWYDANGNGVQDPGELGLANVQVTLVGDLDGDGQADDTLTTVTDGDGHYLFDKLPAGTYAVTVDSTTLPAGMEETYDLDGTGSTNTAQVTIGDNEANLDVDFGYKGTGSIGDTIWYDADNDGVQDPGEAGIPGVTVTITGDFDNDGQADDTMTVTTGPDGTYLFPNLPAGEYDITVDPATLPDGMQPAGDPDTTLDNTTHLSLTAGEINLDQDFGYTGSGSIGDQVWNDRNGNGVLDPGEAPLPGVQVCIGVDLDGDGTPDYHATTTTDADGTYLFDNLPAGTHTICINPDTLPPGIRPSFDPDGVNDNTTTVTLGIGEHNRAIDFGYQYPPPPQPAPIPPIVPPTPEPVPGFGSDPLLSYQQFGDREIKDIFLYPLPEIPWQEAIIPVSPIYTGHAEPGTTLEFTLYDVMGNQIGQQSIMADTAGNWLVDFPGTIMYDLPHHMAITQTISSYNVSSAGFFNMRTYFSPNFSSMVFSSTTLDVDTIFAYLPSTILDSMHAANMSAVNIQWDDFNEYEFFAPSTQPAKTGH